MLDDLDEVLRRVLVRELPIRNNEIDIAFNQPKKEWSARLSRPTLNLFMYDVRENVKLRQPSPPYEVVRAENGTVTQRRKGLRVNVYYMVTAWATEPEDEHRLLGRALIALFRWPQLVMDDLPGSLQDQPSPITLQVAQQDALDKPTDLWGVLDNQIRPALSCIVTLTINPYQPFVTPAVRTVQLGTSQSEHPEAEAIGGDSHGQRLNVRGTVRSPKPLKNVRIAVVERGRDAQVIEGSPGRPGDATHVDYVVSNIDPGSYTLEVTADSAGPIRRTIIVPSSNYDILL